LRIANLTETGEIVKRELAALCLGVGGWKTGDGQSKDKQMEQMSLSEADHDRVSSDMEFRI